MNARTIQSRSAVFGRSDVARLLAIPEWLVANLASKRYPYGLTPSVRRGKGRGKKGLYSLEDVYKIAVAHRLLAAGFASRVVAEALKELFPAQESIEIAARAAPDNRYILLDLSRWVDQGNVPEEWRTSSDTLHQAPWARLVRRTLLVQEWQTEALRAAFAMPFDELLNWVDSRILGRKITF